MRCPLARSTYVPTYPPMETSKLKRIVEEGVVVGVKASSHRDSKSVAAVVPCRAERPTASSGILPPTTKPSQTRKHTNATAGPPTTPAKRLHSRQRLLAIKDGGVSSEGEVFDFAEVDRGR
jgi:hypothetical protein